MKGEAKCAGESKNNKRRPEHFARGSGQDFRSFGSIMAKNFYGMMENSAKMYEAIKEHREKDYFPIVSIRKKDIYEVMSPKEVKKETALLVAAALQNDTRVEALIPNGDGKVKPEPVPVIGKGCDVKHLTKVKEGFYQKFLCNMGDPFAEKKEYEDTMEEVL